VKSEAELCAELQLSLVERSARDYRSGTLSIVDVVIRLRECCMVEGIEGFDTNLDVLSLGEIKNFAKSKIGRHCSGANQSVFPRVAERIGLRKREAIHIEPIVDASFPRR